MNIDRECWELDASLTELLFESNLSIRQIATELGMSEQKVNQRIKQLGLCWVRRNNRKLSRGHAALTTILKKLLPNVEIVNEHHIGERLMLDIYCPKYKLAIEFHGRQHFTYVAFFHEDQSAFKASVQRDLRKIELCKEQGINLIAFRFNDSLTEEAVFDRILTAIREVETTKPLVKSIHVKNTTLNKGNPIYEGAKQRRKEMEKEFRIKMKQEKDNKRLWQEIM